MKKEPKIDSHQYYVKNPLVFNKRFDFESNPITNWIEPDWIIGDPAEEQQWFIEANLGREDEMWDSFYFKTHRRHKGYWVWFPYESIGRGYEEAILGLIAATRVSTPLILSDKQEYDYLVSEIKIIDRQYELTH